ncbi:NHL domain-containing protein [Jiangella endophytica]|uniref:NHL domain-containing protein n=1 Tax=Jiangella endophytica TaxID=1623398 RepID=UPI0013007242|nr:SMP-30/gluconolactonase/LRE family protein [Jiangella endophytica]
MGDPVVTRALLPALLFSTGLLAGTAVPAAGGETPTGEAPSAEAPSAEALPGQPVAIAGIGSVGYSGDGGAATEARVNDRLQVSVGPDGTVYVADRYNKRVRVVTPDGVIDTLAGTRAQRSPETDGIEVPGLGTFSPSNAPIATAVGPDGSVYVAGDDDVRRVASDGTVTVLAGAGDERIEAGDPDGGQAVDASIHEPSDIAVDAGGNVYVADTNSNRVRRIGTDGVITTVAGGGEASPESAEGQPGTSLDTYAPTSVAVDSRGSVYFTTQLSGSVFGIEPDGTLRVIGGDDIALIRADLPAPGAATTGGRRLAVDADDNLYMTDPDNQRLRVLSAADGEITTVGPLPSTTQDIAIGAEGDLVYAADSRVWRVADPTAVPAAAELVEPAGSPWPDADPGTVVTVAGVAGAPEEAPAPVQPDDPAAGPVAVVAGPGGVTYVADTLRHVIHQVDADGAVSTLAGTGEGGFGGDGGPATAAQLSSPSGLDVDAAGNVYVADAGNSRIRRVGTDGVITTVAGAERPEDYDDQDPEPLCVGEPAVEAVLAHPVDVAVGADGSVYLADPSRGLVCRVGTDGLLTTVAGGGRLWADDADDEPAVQASLWEPSAIDVDAEGNVYVIENGRPHVRMVRPDGVLVAVAGNSYFGQDEGGFSGDGGPAAEAELNTPLDLAVAPDGSLFIADTFNSRIRHVDADGVITTVAGTGSPHDTGDGGPAADAELNEPSAIDVDPGGEIVISSPRSDVVRHIDGDGVIETLAAFRMGDAVDEPVDEAELSTGMTIAVGPDGSLTVADGQALRLRTTDGDIFTDVLAGDATLGGLGQVATGPGGEVYVSLGQTVARVFPDSRLVTIAGGVSNEQPIVDGALATTQMLSPKDVAVGPDGTVFVLDDVRKAVYEIRHDGTLHTVAGFDAVNLAQPHGMAVGPDGTVYVTDVAVNLVFASSGDEAEKFAGNGQDVVENDDVGDGGPATEAVVRSPRDVVVDESGNVFVETADGVRRIDPDGTITTALTEPEEGDPLDPETMAVGPGGDLYVVAAAQRQVLAVVRPGEVSGPFPWLPVSLGAGAVVLLAGATVLLVRRRARQAGTSTAPATASEGPAPA